MTKTLSPDPSRTGPTREGLDDIALLEAQLAALRAWHHDRRLREQQETLSSGASREARLDAARSLELLAAEHDALLRHAESFLTGPLVGLPTRRRARIVFAHRNAWLRDKIQGQLPAESVEVITSTDDGAEAVAAVICEQPDLLFVEDLLPRVPGVDVALRTRSYAPHTLVAVHAAGREHMTALLEAGARGWFSRRIPPAEVADGLLQLLTTDRMTTLQLL